MGWSIGYQQLREPELLDEFFAVVGKALYLATAFEKKCKYVFRVLNLVDLVETTGDASAAIELARAMKDKMLGGTISDLGRDSSISVEDIALLEGAKNARNYIAHECADIGLVNFVSEKVIRHHMERLKQEVELLVAGDNVVSRWVYEIEEKEPAPSSVTDAYPGRLKAWLFGGLAG